MQTKLSTRGIKRLEMTMRDVLDGLEDAAIYTNYHSSPDIVEILSIEPPGRLTIKNHNVIPMSIPTNNYDDADIVDYLIQRESKRSA